MEIKIKKGNHRSNLFLPSFVFDNKVIGTVIFKDDFSYEIQKQKDTNKLFGISDGWHHRLDSVRIGWRWDINRKQIQIMGIFYTNGYRTIEPICFIEPNTLYNFVVYIDEHEYVIKFNNYEVRNVRLSNWNFVRYYLYPFFGGTTKAPKTFTFKIDIIRLWKKLF